jgi:VanZ family protein
MTMIIVLTIVPPLLRPVTGTPHNVEHLAIFLVTGAAFGLGYPRRESILCTLAILFSAMLEVAQLLIPGRHATFSDFLVDILSACAGIAAASLLGSARVQVSTR